MAGEYEVFLMEESDNAVTFKRNRIMLKDIPSTINGEEGRHICFVRTLTELIAHQLTEFTDKYSLDEETISKIALASTLHDIGKTKIPEAIIEKRGALTPLEYDIVKKHTVLGYEILEEWGGSIDGDIVDYAKEIARHHHERFDGTGYPDGIAGDEIPICAQIVSIADSYEALTAERVYKNALSSDVALEMISNGMCGVFNPLLVECLVRVANHKQLDDILKSLTATNAVYVSPYALTPRKILLMGNLRYVTEKFIDDTFPDSYISIIGKCSLPDSKNIKIYDMAQPHYKAIFDTYDYDLIIYFANELTYDTIDQSDTEELRQILKYSKYISSNAKFLYLSSLDAAFESRSDRGIVSASKEDLCRFWAKQNNVNLKIVRIPYLYNGAAKNDFLYDIFDEMRLKGSVRMREARTSRMYFLSETDLSELIIRIADTWTEGDGILNVNDDFFLDFGDLADAVERLEEGVKFDFTDKNPPKTFEHKNTAIKQQYSWFSKISILTDLREQYDEYLETVAPKQSRWERIKEYLRKYSWILKFIELILFFVVCEVLVRLTDSMLFFSVVDFRLAYIVVMGTMHGLPCGMGAAALCSVSWTVAKVMSGTNLMTIFYEPTNWLAFIIFFLVGAICGYVKMKKDIKIQFEEEENRLLEEKLTFTRGIYEDTFNEKRDLKKQIIGSKDSFGKIFNITRQLNTVDSRELYLKIVNSFEEVLENKTVSVYTVSNASSFARLEVASRDIMNAVSRSIDLDKFAPVMDVIKRNEVWRNKDLIPGMPMFACGVFKGDTPLLLIFIWAAQMHQRSLYYVNLFRILCDLTQMSLIRAHDYSSALHDRQYVPSTIMQNAETFRSNLAVFKELHERRIFRYLLLSVEREGRTDFELSELISKCVRTNDIVGLLEDGSVWLLLSQAGESDLQFIIPRFERLGLTIKQGTLPMAGDSEAPTEEEAPTKDITPIEEAPIKEEQPT